MAKRTRQKTPSERRAQKQVQKKKSAKVRETKADLETLEQNRRELTALISSAEYWLSRGAFQLAEIDAKILGLKNTRAEIEFKIEQAPQRLESLKKQMTQLESRIKKTAARPVVDKLASTMAQVQALATEMGVTPEELQQMLARKSGGAS